MSSQPAIAKDGTIYFGTSNHFFYALDPDGTSKWSYEVNTQEDFSSVVVDSGGTIYFGCDKFYALNPNGTVKWVYTPPTPSNFRFPVMGFDGTILVYSV